MATSNRRPPAALFYDFPPLDGDVYAKKQRARIESLTGLFPQVVHAGNFDAYAADLADVEVIFATWGMMCFDDTHFERLPKLRAVFYAAGNVKSFAWPLIEHGVQLVSAWEANAIPASELCLGQILLSFRGYFRAVRAYRVERTHAAKTFHRPGLNGETVGLIGLGKIGSRLRRLLADYPIKVIAYDPSLTDKRAAELNVESVSLSELFQRAYVVSNHTPDIESTQGVLRHEHFAHLREGATFINSGRGAQIVESDLIAVLRDRPDLTALLDVTDPEPPGLDSALWSLPNVTISPHIGGSIGDEVERLATLAIDEFEAWHSGQPLTHEVTREILTTMG